MEKHVVHMMDAAKVCFAKYSDFQGRSDRVEFWYFIAFACLFVPLMSSLNAIFFGLHTDFVPLTIIGLFAILCPVCAVTARRLQDVNRPGRWQALALIPAVPVLAFQFIPKLGSIEVLSFISTISTFGLLAAIMILAFWCSRRGDPTVNAFGEAPEIREDESRNVPETYIYNQR